MQPDKLSTDASATETSLETAKNITADALLKQLSALIETDKFVDEHRAKQLRKSWNSIKLSAKGEKSTHSELEKGFETLRERIHKQVETRNTQFEELEQYLSQLKNSLQIDDLKSAQEWEKKVISNLNRIRGLSTQRRQKVIGELEALQPKIKKLSSWRHWGTLQAREKIIEEIQQIHESENNLEEVARRIKQAREQWKQWDHSGEGGDHKLYQAFDNACTKAYEPCKAHFETQRKQRIASSRERLKICEQLESEYENTDWRNPDWKKVQQLTREKASRWRKLGPAEYRDRKSLHRRFDQIIAKFDGPLVRERKRNLRQREDLVDSINKLSELEDSRKAVSELQTLKKNWVVTVSGKRHHEQAIWKKFTSACDAIYEKSRQSKKQFEQQLRQNLQVKTALCDQIESELESETADTMALTSYITKWKQQWSETGRAPKASAKQIEKRFRDVLDKANKAVVGLNQAEQSKKDQILFECASFCTELERQVLQNSNPDVNAANQRWQQFDAIDQDLRSSMQHRMEQVLKAATDTSFRQEFEQALEQNFDHINGYLLQLEINAGVESPAHYAKQRMALQISRLSTAMGKDSAQELLHNQELINRIHTTGGVPLSKQTEAGQRFTLCYQALNHDDS